MCTVSSVLFPLILFKMGGGKKVHPTSFSPEISTNVGVSTQNILTFNFNNFSTPVQNFKAISSSSSSPKLLNLNQEHPSKKLTFLVKSS